MIHRSAVRLAAATLGIVALGSCATFSDDNLAARVGDAKLTQDDLERLLLDKAALDAEAAGTEPSDIPPKRVPTSEAAGVITTFVLNHAIRADLAALGSPLDEPAPGLGYEELQVSANEALTAWQSLPPKQFSDDELRALYDLGLEGSKIACTAHILVASKANADQVLTRLESGDLFSELAAEFSTDPGSATQGGVLPCDMTTNFSTTYIPEFVDAALDAQPGTPVGPIESQFGQHIILVRSFDEIDRAEIEPILSQPLFRFEVASKGLDIYVNPRYGTFEPSAGVVPLG